MQEFLASLQNYAGPVTGILGLISGMVSLIVGIWTFRRVKREESHREESLRNQKKANEIQEKNTDVLEKQLAKQTQQMEEQTKNSVALTDTLAKVVAKTNDTGPLVMNIFEQLQRWVESRLDAQEKRYLEVVEKLIDQFEQAKGQRESAQRILLEAQATAARQEIERNQQALVHIEKAEGNLARGESVEEVLPELGPLGDVFGAFASLVPLPFLGELFGFDPSENERQRRTQLQQQLTQRSQEITQKIQKFRGVLESIRQQLG